MQIVVVGAECQGQLAGLDRREVVLDLVVGPGERAQDALVGLGCLPLALQQDVADPLDGGNAFQFAGGLQDGDHVADGAGLLGQQVLGVDELGDGVFPPAPFYLLHQARALAACGLALQRNLAQPPVPALDVVGLPQQALAVHLHGEVPIAGLRHLFGPLEEGLALSGRPALLGFRLRHSFAFSNAATLIPVPMYPIGAHLARLSGAGRS